MKGAKISKTMRLSEEIIDMIEKQKGDTFTEKFENLIRISVQELPKKQQELKNIQDWIEKERNELRRVRDLKQKFESNLRDMNWALEQAARQVKRVASALENIET